MIGPDDLHHVIWWFEKDEIMNKIQENFKLKMASCKDEAAEAVWGQKIKKEIIWHEFPLLWMTKSTWYGLRSTYFSLPDPNET